jgi:hypothetical protein
MDCAS